VAWLKFAAMAEGARLATLSCGAAPEPLRNRPDTLLGGVAARSHDVKCRVVLAISDVENAAAFDAPC
jgi:hypothetical protein